MTGWLAWWVDALGVPTRRRDRLARVLEPCGFAPMHPTGPGNAGWRGSPDGIPITVHTTRGSLEVRVRAVPAGFERVRRRTPFDDAPLLGDPTFDAVVAVRAPDPARVLGVLGPAERVLLCQAVRDGWHLVDGAWVLTCSAPDDADPGPLVRRAVALGKIGRSPAPVGSGLGARLADPQKGVRDNALSLLLGNPAWSDEWQALLRSDEPRTLLAVAVVRRDRDTLRGLGRHVDPTVACDAWLTLLDLGPHPVATEHFEPLFCQLLDAARHPADERPQPSLDEALRWKRILSALARFGTPAALIRLHATSEHVLPGEVRRRLPATTAAIRVRYPAPLGSLSLADTPSGASPPAASPLSPHQGARLLDRTRGRAPRDPLDGLMSPRGQGRRSKDDRAALAGSDAPPGLRAVRGATCAPDPAERRAPVGYGDGSTVDSLSLGVAMTCHTTVQGVPGGSPPGPVQEASPLVGG